jgi:hypothetical protein
MIDSRYHLVSIVAVFLALAIGIVLGSTELQGPTYSVLDSTTWALQNQVDQVTGMLDAAQAQANVDEAYAAAVEPTVLRGLLTGQRLVIITEPGAQASVATAITNAATSDAGATITGQIALQPKLFDTGNATQSSLKQVNMDMAQASGIMLDSSETSQQQAAQVLATEILTKWPGSSGQPATSPQAMLAAYANSGFLTTSGQPATQATLAVVITPQNAPIDGSSAPPSELLVPLAEELAAHSSATVVAGSATGSGPGSPIAVLRASSATSQVSTVDDADFISGQTMVIQALATQLGGGKPASYGIVGNAAVVDAPSPAPTPSAASISLTK